MTSELKPCPFCNGKALSKFTDMEAVIWCEPCVFKMVFSTAMVSLRIAEEYQRKMLTHRWNSRATPSADTLAGLVALNDHDLCKLSETFGAQISWANDLEDFHHLIEFTPPALRALIEELHVENTKLKNELAQIKAQKPVAHVLTSKIDELHVKGAESALAFIRKHGYKSGGTPLYAAPVDQTAEIERLREGRELFYEISKEWKERALKAERALAALQERGKEPS